jgi:hypothetical protein
MFRPISVHPQVHSLCLKHTDFCNKQNNGMTLWHMKLLQFGFLPFYNEVGWGIRFKLLYLLRVVSWIVSRWSQNVGYHFVFWHVTKSVTRNKTHSFPPTCLGNLRRRQANLKVQHLKGRKVQPARAWAHICTFSYPVAGRFSIKFLKRLNRFRHLLLTPHDELEGIHPTQNVTTPWKNADVHASQCRVGCNKWEFWWWNVHLQNQEGDGERALKIGLK